MVHEQNIFRNNLHSEQRERENATIWDTNEFRFES